MKIYRIRNLINDKVYIGKSKDPPQRWEAHKNAASKGSELLFHRAIRKYGEESFELEVLCDAIGDGSEGERLAIQENDCCILDGNEKGYNMTRGGDGFDSESTSHYLNKITAEGRNPFTRGNSGYFRSMESQQKRIEGGEHNFQSLDHREKVRETQHRLVRNGEHPLAGERGSIHSKAVQKKRIEEGTFHMHQPEMKEHQRRVALEAVKSGTHNSQLQSTCPYCDHTGNGPAMKRWHFDKCKKKI